MTGYPFYYTVLTTEELLEVAHAALSDNFESLTSEAEDLRLALQHILPLSEYHAMCQTPVQHHYGVSRLAMTCAEELMHRGLSGHFKRNAHMLLWSLAQFPQASAEYREDKKRRMQRMEMRSYTLWLNKDHALKAPYLDVLKTLLMPRRLTRPQRLAVLNAAHMACKCIRFTPQHSFYEQSNKERLDAAIAALDGVMV